MSLVSRFGAKLYRALAGIKLDPCSTGKRETFSHAPGLSLLAS
jgi:hypothetical protein